jgi:hypothetical protein
MMRQSKLLRYLSNSIIQHSTKYKFNKKIKSIFFQKYGGEFCNRINVYASEK